MSTATSEPSLDQEIDQEHYHYVRKYHFMTEAEQTVFKMIDDVFGSKYYIFAQVYLPTIVYVQEHLKSRILGALHRINKYSIDYVICDRDSMQPLLAIELDDWSHALASRRWRDRFVEHILNEADLELLRLSHYHEKGRDEIIREVQGALSKVHVTSRPQVEDPQDFGGQIDYKDN